jgi:hypothetical protein
LFPDFLFSLSLAFATRFATDSISLNDSILAETTSTVYNFFMYGVNNPEMLIYTPTPIPCKVTFQHLYLSGSGSGMLFQLLEQGKNFCKVFFFAPIASTDLARQFELIEMLL